MSSLVVIPTHGFGNRLRMIASSMVLSKYMNMSLYICWERDEDCCLDIHSIWYNFPIKTITMNTIVSSKYKYFGLVHTNDILNNIKPSDEIDYFVIKGGHEFKPNEMSLNEYLNRKYKFYSSLKFKCESQLKNIPTEFACIHYRDITYHDENDIKKSARCNFTQNTSFNDFSSFIKRIDDSLPLYIVSNNNNIINNFKKKFPTKSLHYIPKVCSKNDRKTYHAMNSILVDFCLLTKAKFIIGTYYSSFSDEASFFNMIPKIIPINTHLHNDEMYHCFNYSIHEYNSSPIGCINHNNNIFIKYCY